ERQDGQERREASAGGAPRPFDVAQGRPEPVEGRSQDDVGQERQERQEGRERQERHKSDVKVITRAVYRANGNPAYVESDRHAHIWTIGVPPPTSSGSEPDPAPAPTTSGDFDERGFESSPDGSTIYFTSTRVPEPYY